jgi:tetratricopeptide (TPR) repeat protein
LKGTDRIAARRPDEALKYTHMAFEIDPNCWPARFYQAEAYETKGMYREAEAEYRKIAEEERLSLIGKYRLIYLYDDLLEEVRRRLIRDIGYGFATTNWRVSNSRR